MLAEINCHTNGRQPLYVYFIDQDQAFSIKFGFADLEGQSKIAIMLSRILFSGEMKVSITEEETHILVDKTFFVINYLVSTNFGLRIYNSISKRASS